jgi:hypothetical protein
MTSTDSFNINLQGTQASTVFLDPVFKSDAITTNFMVMGNVTGGSKKIKYHAVVENILKKYTGCGFQANEATDFTEKEVYLKKMAADLQYCWEDFSDILFESAYKQGVADWTDLTGTQIQTIFQGLFVNGLIKDINRLAYFGNTSSTSANFDAVDGMWSVIYPREVAATRTPKVDLGAGKDTAAELAAGDGVLYMQQVWDKQSDALYGISEADKVFNVSRSIFERFRKDMQAVGNNVQNNADFIQNGYPVLKFNGVDVVCQPTWTTDLVAAGLTTALGGTPSLGENLIELTARFNKVLVSNLNGFDFNFRTWYEQKDEKVYIMSRPKIGFDIVHGTLAVVAYK